MRRFLLFPILAAACLVLAGCSDVAKVGNVVADSGKAASAEGTVRFESHITGSDEEGDHEATSTGVIDFDNRRTSFTLDADGETSEFIVDGDDMYVRGGGISASAWVFIEDGMDSLGAGDPRSAFAALRKTQGARKVDQETIRGERTTRYEVSLKSRDALAASGVPFATADDDFPASVDADAWLDEHGLLRRLRFELAEANDEAPTVFDTEFWDYGQAPPVELPDDADVLDPLDFGDDDDGPASAAASAFRDADCYGERVKDCLAPNPKVDAMAGDPALCTGETARLCLVPVGTVRDDLIEAIVKFHSETKDIDVVVLPSVPLPAGTVDLAHSQVTEWAVYELAKAAYGVTDAMPSTFIAITPIDIRPRENQFGWMFGARFGRGYFGENDGAFSTFRMENVTPYDGKPITDDLVQLRVSKYTARYTSLLFFDYPVSEDVDYLNYYEMYGFSDLDSMGTNWPISPRPCTDAGDRICVFPDMGWDDEKFGDDIEVAVARLEQTLGIPVEIRNTPGYHATQDNWSLEAHNDLSQYSRPFLSNAALTVIGVTDDNFAQVSSVAAHTDASWPDERIAVVSGYGAGRPGTTESQERIFRLLLRAVAHTRYGVPFTSDATSLMWDGVTKPTDLDGKTLPVLAR
ncbi:hypothetical protein AYO38_00990 [bacterium SCGC AG-212-C10]|nr:hypothetical protein AYO38_00990 [bacterium SCGC AG-212-C10]